MATTTSKTLRHVIDVLSLPPGERTPQMISSVSTWLQRATNIFTDMDRGKDSIRYARIIIIA